MMLLSDTKFITEQNQLLDILTLTLVDTKLEILISGNFDNIIYKKLFDTILKSNNLRECKIIIPYISSTGIMSRQYINKLCKVSGNIRSNSQFRSNLIVIGNVAFILNFSAKYHKEEGMKYNFECAIKVENLDTVSDIRNSFMEKWNHSLPLVN